MVLIRILFINLETEVFKRILFYQREERFSDPVKIQTFALFTDSSIFQKHHFNKTTINVLIQKDFERILLCFLNNHMLAFWLNIDISLNKQMDIIQIYLYITQQTRKYDKKERRVPFCLEGFFVIVENHYFGTEFLRIMTKNHINV